MCHQCVGRMMLAIDDEAWTLPLPTPNECAEFVEELGREVEREEGPEEARKERRELNDYTPHYFRDLSTFDEVMGKLPPRERRPEKTRHWEEMFGAACYLREVSRRCRAISGGFCPN